MGCFFSDHVFKEPFYLAMFWASQQLDVYYSIEGEKSELGQQRSDMDSFCSEMNETKSGPSNLEESQNVRIREPSGNDDIGIQPSVLPNLSVPFPKGLHLPDIKRQIMLVNFFATNPFPPNNIKGNLNALLFPCTSKFEILGLCTKNLKEKN